MAIPSRGGGAVGTFTHPQNFVPCLEGRVPQPNSLAHLPTCPRNPQKPKNIIALYLCTGPIKKSSSPLGQDQRRFWSHANGVGGGRAEPSGGARGIQGEPAFAGRRALLTRRAAAGCAAAGQRTHQFNPQERVRGCALQALAFRSRYRYTFHIGPTSSTRGGIQVHS